MYDSGAGNTRTTAITQLFNPDGTAVTPEQLGLVEQSMTND